MPVKSKRKSAPRKTLEQRIVSKAETILQERGFRDVIAMGGQNSDWNFNGNLSMDSSVWQWNSPLRSRMRDLADQTCYFQKYRESLWGNVFGENGITLQMKIRETGDRVVTSEDEKAGLYQDAKRYRRVFDYVERKRGIKPSDDFLRDFCPHIEYDGRAKTIIKVGEPDVFANMMIERLWNEWQRAEFCDIRGQRTYNALRQLRLWSCVRDGDHFIRMVKHPKVNKFGLTLQLINAEWCDYWYNAQLPNGNVIRMGIEYQFNPWGLGKPVAYYFIKRQPMDWQFTVPGAFDFSGGNMHERVLAEDIIHYARYTDSDSTRPAPWGASTIPKSRQLDEYELAEVIAARAQACKTGWLYSDLVPEGGFVDGKMPNPQSVSMKGIQVQPGGLYGLPWGVKIQESDPTHPSQNFDLFRKGMGRSISAGLPGADYNQVFNDLEGINFSAGRLGRLDSNETNKLLQRFDIDTAERPIFEAFLEMGLLTGTIPLPLAKFDKFNKPVFVGRRWQEIDQTKAVNASALKVANKFSSRSMECSENGVDFEEVVMELAAEEMLMESLGLNPATTVESTPPAQTDDSTDPETGGTKKPSPKINGTDKSNGHNRVFA